MGHIEEAKPTNVENHRFSKIALPLRYLMSRINNNPGYISLSFYRVRKSNHGDHIKWGINSKDVPEI